MARIEGQRDSDPTAEIITEMENASKELTRDIAMFWFEKSQNWLEEAAANRSELGKQHGHTGRETNGLHAIQQTAVPPSWNEQEEHWSFSYPHAGAVFQEFGAKPHEVRAKKAEVLAFEWPDAPEDVKEQFSHTEGDLVFFESINHPGIPAIGFVRRGRDKTQLALERKGYDTSTFGAQGDGST